MPNGNGEEKTLLEAEKEFTRFYKLSLWWVTHREGLKRIGLGALLFIEGLVLLFVVWTFTDSFLVSYRAERDAVAALAVQGQADLRAYSVATAARPLETTGATSFALGEGEYDLYASVENPNGDWWAEFSYRFTWSGGETEQRQGFILPSEEKPVIVFSFESETPPRGVDFEITDLSWHRVDKRLVGEYDRFAADRLRLEITEVEILPPASGNGVEVPARVSFTVRNAIAFSYYDPAFYILLMRGPNVVGVNLTTLSSLDAGERQEVAVNWFDGMPPATRAEIVPEVNIFDPDTYKPVQGRAGLDARESAP